MRLRKHEHDLAAALARSLVSRRVRPPDEWWFGVSASAGELTLIRGTSQAAVRAIAFSLRSPNSELLATVTARPDLSKAEENELLEAVKQREADRIRQLNVLWHRDVKEVRPQRMHQNAIWTAVRAVLTWRAMRRPEEGEGDFMALLAAEDIGQRQQTL